MKAYSTSGEYLAHVDGGVRAIQEILEECATQWKMGRNEIELERLRDKLNDMLSKLSEHVAAAQNLQHNEQHE